MKMDNLFYFLTRLFTGPPVNVSMAIEVASIDHISEANMVMFENHPISHLWFIILDLYGCCIGQLYFCL